MILLLVKVVFCCSTSLTQQSTVAEWCISSLLGQQAKVFSLLQLPMDQGRLGSVSGWVYGVGGNVNWKFVFDFDNINEHSARVYC